MWEVGCGCGSDSGSGSGRRDFNLLQHTYACRWIKRGEGCLRRKVPLKLSRFGLKRVAVGIGSYAPTT